MRRFRFNDTYTSADMGLDIEGDSLEELFAAGAEGMFAVILGRVPEGGTTVRSITLAAEGREQLLVDWLSDLLFHFDADGLIPTAYTLAILRREDAYHLTGDVSFRAFDPSREQAEHEVKAVTYYRLKIVRRDGGLACHVVFDL